MGFLELLTIIFIVLKVFGLVAWSWWVVFTPLLITIGIYVLLIIIFGTSMFAFMKDIVKDLK